MAFAKTKLKAWPFNGPILVMEKNENLEEALIFDKWCYLGKYSEYNSSQDTLAISDFDVYKILDRFLKDEGNLKKISTISQQSILEVKSLYH